MDDGYQAALAYFGNSDHLAPTAVTCYNDLLALGVLKALREAQIHVPDEISVIGFDDLEILQYFPLPLTTVRVPKWDMGRLATEMLIRQIESKKSLGPERISLESGLIIRDSTRAIDVATSNQSAIPYGRQMPEGIH